MGNVLSAAPDIGLLQSILDGIEESIVVLDKEYHIVCFNNAFRGWLEKPKKKIIGEFCYSVIHDHDVRCNVCIVRDTFRTGQYFETSHSHERENGRVYHETRSYPIKDAKGEVKYAIYMFRDITERALIEEKVRELDKFKKKILDNAGVAINILDKEGNIMNVNRGSETLFGWAEEDVKGEPHSIFYKKEDTELLAKTMKQAFAKGEYKAEVTLVKKNKNEFPAHLTLTPVEDDHGSITALIEIVNDLTQLKKAERVIKQQLEKLKELDAMKEEYFYATSHEFKTPLTTIMSLTKLLLDGKIGSLTKEQKEALELVYCDTRRLRGAVQRILDIAKIESGKMVYHMDKVDIEPIVDEIISTLRILSGSKGIIVNKSVEGGLPHVTADKDRLEMAIENLMNNAIKFTPPGGRIDIRAKRDGDSILVEIQDTGIGIPPEDKDKVFEKYYQVKNGQTENVGGSGIGLVICKRIIEAFKGRLWVESNLGEGSTFKFTIPCEGIHGGR